MHKVHIYKATAVWLTVVIVSITLWFVYRYNIQPPPEEEMTFCTQEAMQCPDGVTYVGRTGPNCEFAKCPTADSIKRYPLYSALEWGEPIKKEWRAFISLDGNESKSTSSQKNAGTEFRKYYDDLLKKDGWVEDLSLDADGVGGSTWGYLKNGKYIILGYETQFSIVTSDSPPKCPCTYSYSIFWDDSKITFEEQIDTSYWQTYRNEEYGFEIKYPKDWKVSEIDDASGLGIFVHSDDQSEDNFIILPKGGFGSGSPFKEPTISEILISDRRARLIYVEDWDEEIQNEELSLIYFDEYPASWSEDNRIDILSFDPSIKKIYEQILPTFKFTQ